MGSFSQLGDDGLLLVLSVVSGLAVWVVDALIDMLVLGREGFWGLLLFMFSIPLSKLVFRMLLLLSFVGYGFIASRYLVRHREAERRLCLSRARYSELFDGVDEGLFKTGLEGEYLLVNPAFAEVLGYSPDEMVEGGVRLYEAFPSKEDADSLLQEAREKGEVRGREYSVVLKDGERIPVEMDVAVMRNVEGTPTGFVGVIRDITERRRMEEERDEALRHFRTLFNVTVDPVVIVDRGGRVLEVTRRVEEVTGYKREGVIGKDFMDLRLLTPESRKTLKENLGKRLRGRDVPPYRVMLVRKTGDRVPFEVNAERIEY